MATWKEIGEVPDSDDEDIWDSENEENGPAGNLVKAADGTSSLEAVGVVESVDVEEGMKQPSGFDCSKDECEFPQHLQDDSPDPLQSLPDHLLDGSNIKTPGASPEIALEPQTNNGSQSLSSFLEAVASTEHFLCNDARILHEDNGHGEDIQDFDDEVQYRQETPRTPHRVYEPIGLPTIDQTTSRQTDSPSFRRPLFDADEILTTFIMLSSPLSILLSPDHPSPMDGILQDSSLDGVHHLTFEDTIPEGIEQCDGVSVESDLPMVRRRNLRERAPIQLHPYAIEQERYRRNLQGHGLKPLRIAQFTSSQNGGESQEFYAAENNTMQDDEHMQQHSFSSQLSYSHNDDSFEVIVENDGREMQRQEGDRGRKTLSPSYAGEQDPFMDPLKIAVDQGQFEEDEFPDISELVRTSSKFAASGIKRRKLATESSPRFSLIQESHSKGSLSCIRSIPSILSQPNSPPKTSSPRMNEMDESSIAKLVDLPDQVPTIDSSPPVVFRKPRDLPTPATSVAKETFDFTSINLDQDETTSDDESVASHSHSDHSAAIEKVGKRIRGVLPASWLRLDRRAEPKKPNLPDVQVRDERTLSPDTRVPRRGVAHPCAKNFNDRFVLAALQSGALLPEDESDNDTPSSPPQFSAESVAGYSLPSELESVIQDDRIDAMLPQKRRQSKLVPGPRKKKLKRSSNSLLLRKNVDGALRQPRIDTFPRQQSRTVIRRDVAETLSNRTSGYRPKQRQSRPKPPRLSILDVISSEGLSEKSSLQTRQPTFLRIAARNARKRLHLARQSPDGKFIRLDTREDTIDAQERLRAWREGTIAPRHEIRPSMSISTQRPAIRTMSDNRSLSVARNKASDKVESTVNDDRQGHSLGQNLVSSQKTQTTMSMDHGFQDLTAEEEHFSGAALQATDSPAIPRPAQLETTESAYQTSFPNAAFRTNKKNLDALYRKRNHVFAFKPNIQLSKFLHDDDSLVGQEPLLLSVENYEAEAHEVLGQSSHEPDVQSSRTQPAVRRKRLAPKRVDVDALKYRQPERLVLQFLNKRCPEKVDLKITKLQGLGVYGTVYTHDFDVLPLPRGVHFHESTFLGSGQFRDVLGLQSSARMTPSHICQLGGKRLVWSRWNATISAELGLCIDTVVEGLTAVHTSPPDDAFDTLLGYVMFILSYVQNDLETGSQLNLDVILPRFVEVFKELDACITSITSTLSSIAVTVLGRLAELLSRTVCVVFVLLRIARSADSIAKISFELESLLQSIMASTIGVLLAIGLEDIWTLCDDLQYLTYREKGIRSDRYAAQAWVSLFYVCRHARIPRATFWDLYNAQVCGQNAGRMNDTSTLEQIWYSLYCLLPLTEINESGVLNSTTRNSLSMENWSLVATLCKTVFNIYASTAGKGQSAGFNDYVRSLYRRCHYLMEHWKWKRHNVIVGLLFDFFATQKLAYLRHEAWSGTSAHFLQELHLKPMITIEPRDVCFHILLKIIGTSFKQMTASGDIRGMRNLITRLLPNHNRQYPKDEAILEDDLLSLQNHHDILCTLFWAAPAEIRPSTHLLRQLVNPASSHRQAYLINLRAWTCLSQFMLATPDEDEIDTWPNPPSLPNQSSAYEPFAVWQAETFVLLRELYHSAEQDAKQQLSSMSETSRNAVTQAEIETIVRSNKVEAMTLMIANLAASRRLICEAKTMDVARIVISSPQCQDVLLSAMSQISITEKSGTQIVEATLDIIDAYIHRLNVLVPAMAISTGISQDKDTQEDSQDYGADVFDEGSPRLEYIGEFDGKIKQAIFDLLRRGHRSHRSVKPVSKDFMLRLVNTWALLAGNLILCGLRTRSSFVMNNGSVMIDNEMLPTDLSQKFNVALDSLVGDSSDD